MSLKSTQRKHRRNFLMKCASMAACTLALMCFDATAQQCDALPPQATEQTIHVTQEIIVLDSTPIGSIIAEFSSTPQYAHPTVYCNAWPYASTYTKPLAPYSYKTYQTNVQGVAIYIYATNGTDTFGTVPYNDSVLGDLTLVNAAFNVRFIKSAAIAEGILEPGRYVELAIRGSTTMALALPAIKFVREPATCHFESMSDVELGTMSASTFDNDSSTSQWINFTVDSTRCVRISDIRMQFQGIANPEDHTLFASTGTAKGVAIELQSADGQAAIPGGAPIAFTASSGPASYSMRARVRKTEDKVLAGTVASAITINLTYE